MTCEEIKSEIEVGIKMLKVADGFAVPGCEHLAVAAVEDVITHLQEFVEKYKGGVVEPK